MTPRAEEQVADVLARFLTENGVGDGEWNEKWAHLKVGPFTIPFPNSKSRQAAVPRHDLHHLATGYQMDWRGEGEIGAFELAGDCRRYPVAWILNLGSFGIGLIIAPVRVYRAFLRGRSASLLYNQKFSERVYDLTLGELRERMRLDVGGSISRRDRLAFVRHALFALMLAFTGPLAFAIILVGIYLPPRPSDYDAI